MSNVMVRRVGTKFEVSNGIVVFSGPNRSDLLAAMDFMENRPASVEAIQAKVDKAGDHVRKVIAEAEAAEAAAPAAVETAPVEAAAKKKATKTVKKTGQKSQSKMDKVKAYVAGQKKGAKFTTSEAAAATGIQKGVAGYLAYLWHAGELQSEERGVYFR